MKINKYLRNWLIYILILIIVFCIIGVASIIGDDKIQVMNNLDYNVTLNKDGSMNVTETWDVYVKNTGTLFKDFYRTDKYPISDVTVWLGNARTITVVRSPAMTTKQIENRAIINFLLPTIFSPFLT